MDALLDTRKTENSIRNATGVTTRLVRPPYGHINNEWAEEITKKGYIIVLWSIDTDDWKAPNQLSILIKALRAKAGDIILLHSANTNSVTLSFIIDGLRRKGLEPVTLSELMKDL
jgi:peptidoglycan/xylan/chitin deacetylase (PgdA/CDA1 family)